MERRAHARKTLCLASRLELGASSRPCTIADISERGLGLRYPPLSLAGVSHLIQPHRESGAESGVLAFFDPQKRQPQELRIKIVRAEAGSLGAVLDEAYPEGFATLYRLGQMEQAQPQGMAAEVPGARLILRQCIDCLQSRLSVLFQGFLQELPATLSLAAATVQKESLRKAYWRALAAFEMQQERLGWRFRQRLAEPLVEGGAGDASLPTGDAKRNFEGWLALKVMVTKAETRYRGELLVLKMRLDQAGITSAAGHLNPLGPNLIGLAFQDALLSLGLEAEVETTCFRLFERRVMKQLGPLYGELNQVLIRHEVLPDLDLSRYLTQQPEQEHNALERLPLKESSAEESREQGEAEPLASDTQEAWRSRFFAATAGVKSALRRLTDRSRRFQEHSREAREHSSFRSLNRLMHLAQDPMPNPDQSALLWTHDEVWRALDRVRLLSPVVTDSSLKDRLESCLHQMDYRLGPEAQLPWLLRESLELVDLFFGCLLECALLSDEARGEIRRLDVAVFKRYQRDQWLFEKPDAPILRLLEVVAQLDRRGGLEEAACRARVTEGIARIVREPEPDDEMVEGVIQELTSLLREQERQFERYQQRYQAAAEGARKVADAHQAVAAEIQQRLGGKSVPKAVFNLIQGGWRELLVVTHLRYGPDNPAWAQHLQLLDDLLEVLASQERPVNAAQLVERVRGSLQTIALTCQQVEKLCRELEAFLAAKSHIDTGRVQIPAASRDAPSLESCHSVAVGSAWFSRVQKLKVGDWFRWRGAGGAWEYVTLAWVAPECNQFLLLSRLGHKVADLSLVELVDNLKSAALQPAPEYAAPLLDQVLQLLLRQAYGRLLERAAFSPTNTPLAEAIQPVDLDSPPDQENLLLRGQKILALQSQSRLSSQFHIQFSAYDARGQWIEPEVYRQAVEQKGWGVELDRWVLGRSLEWMARHPASLKRVDSLCLSLSGNSLGEEGILEFVYERLSQSEAPLDKLCFDFDESVAREAPEVLAAFMEEFKEYGCRFSLSCPSWDLSGYKLWSQLPLDFIRVDLRQLRHVQHDERQQALLSGLAELVHLAGLELVATQVESRTCLDLLKALGLDYAQGYGIEKPRQLSSL